MQQIQNRSSQAQPATHKKRGSSLAITIVITAIVVSVIGAALAAWQQQRLADRISKVIDQNKKESADNNADLHNEINEIHTSLDALEKKVTTLETSLNKKTSTSPTSDACNLSDPGDLKPTTADGEIGNYEFDTLLCGYLKVREEKIFGENYSSAYLAITEFYSDAFKDHLDKLFAEGNTYNAKEGDTYLFRLGCYEDGEIKRLNENINTTITKTLNDATDTNPATVKLSFGIIDGHDSPCGSMAKLITIRE